MAKVHGSRTKHIYEYILGYICENNYPPTNREIAAALGYNSLGSVAYQLHKLEEDGLIDLDPKSSRAISVKGWKFVPDDDVKGE